MTVRFKQPNNEGIYFITFTCFNWISLFELTQSHSLVYKWFDYLIIKGHYISGYVIMPNHVHAVIAFTRSEQSINTQIGNGKRFLAYGIVQKIKEIGNQELLAMLQSGVNNTDKSRGKIHQVFEPSFDCKECISHEMTVTKLNYIHANPCSEKWHLTSIPEDYIHSSAKFYATGEQGIFPVKHYLELDDIDFTGKNHSK